MIKIDKKRLIRIILEINWACHWSTISWGVLVDLANPQMPFFNYIYAPATFSFKYKPPTIKKLFHIFTPKERLRFTWLALAILVMGILEVVGVASILPFMQLIAEPDAITQNEWLSWAYETLQFTSPRQMLVTSGIAVIVLIAASNLFSVFTIWLQYKYSWTMAHQLAVRLLRYYLEKPYSYFLGINTSELRTYLISEIGVLISGIMVPLIEFCSRLVVSTVILILLVIINPVIALSAIGILSGFYFLVYITRQKQLKLLGEQRLQSNVKRYQSLEELLNGIKTVKAYEADDYFFRRYEKASKTFTDIVPRFNLVKVAPRYILEIFAFGGILTITLLLFVNSDNLQSALPVLSLYAVAGYRLMPALQKAFGSLATLRHNWPVLERLYQDLIDSLPYEDFRAAEEVPPLQFQGELHLDRISFQYDNSDRQVLNELTVRIPKGQVVAFIGSTGAGKTTIVDLIVGLLQPGTGHIKLDERIIGPEDRKAWHEQIAYVPQDVFLYDDTVANNVVIGVENENIDPERLKRATQMADIYDFIQEKLPEGFATKIGERGVRLSGGQRQRLGLARALYRQPSVLLLDEATSALDNLTEKGILESLNKLPEDLTIIIIAHRFSAVRQADHIYLLEEGRIVAQGNYDELMHSNHTFRTLVQLS